MVSIQERYDAKCLQTVRDMRRPDGVACLSRITTSVVKNGRDEPQRQRYECCGCGGRFDDLAGIVFHEVHVNTMEGV